MSLTRSEYWRSKGRDYHNKALFQLKRAEEVDLIRKNEEPFIFLQQGKELLQQAVTCYSKATKEALTHSELASAHKNCAKALVTLSYNEYDQGKIVENIQVLYHFSRALNSGLLSSFPDQWLNSLQDEYVNCFRNSLKICEQFDFRPKVTYLVKIERVIVDECFKFRCLTEICDSFLKIIVPLFGKKEYESVLVYTQECSTFLTEADQVAVTRRDKILLSEMKKSNNALKIQASAILKMFKADDVLESIKRFNQINEDALYEVIDWYTRVLQMTENKGFVASEAYGRLAYVYKTLLNNETCAKLYEDRRIELGDTNQANSYDHPGPSWGEEDLPVARYKSNRKNQGLGMNKPIKEDNKRDTGENKLDTGKNRQDTGKNRQDTGDNKQDTGENKRDTEENKQDTGENKLDTGENKQHIGEINQDTEDNKLDTGDIKQDPGKYKQDTGNNKQDTGDNKLETGDNRQDTGENKLETGNNNQDTGENKQDTGDNKLEVTGNNLDTGENTLCTDNNSHVPEGNDSKVQKIDSKLNKRERGRYLRNDTFLEEERTSNRQLVNHGMKDLRVEEKQEAPEDMVVKRKDYEQPEDKTLKLNQRTKNCSPHQSLKRTEGKSTVKRRPSLFFCGCGRKSYDD